MEDLTRQRDEALAKLKNLQAKVLTVQTATSLKRLKVEIEKERGL
jgi:hypothetical protein